MRVIFGVSPSVARCLTRATPILLALLSGCEPEGYPAELKYPTRTDVIVIKANPDEVYRAEPPGQLEISIDEYKKLKEQAKDVEAYDPANLSGKDRSAIAASLDKHFGTPAKPLVQIKLPDADANDEFQDAVKELQLEDKALESGSKLYRRHCLHCHGVTGNGRGPTAPWLHPHPRDYRKGKFKFTSTGKRSPSRDDLLRTLKNGIDYTSMPSFGLLPDSELDDLVSYVIHLSLRGQAEEATMTALLKKDLEVDSDRAIDDYLQDQVRKAVLDGGGWRVANKTVLTPSAPPSENPNKEDVEKDIAIGYKLFIGDDAGCLKCHKDFGRQSLYRFDDWGTPVAPRDLTAGTYRGGRRPIDLYWRLKGGIKWSAMPEVADVLLTPDEKTELKMEDKGRAEKLKVEYTERNIWRIVAFVQAVPYPAMLPDEVRKEVYPSPSAKKD
jgi:mono/diheme cytochrome c family protein